MPENLKSSKSSIENAWQIYDDRAARLLVKKTSCHHFKVALEISSTNGKKYHIIIFFEDNALISIMFIPMQVGRYDQIELSYILQKIALAFLIIINQFFYNYGNYTEMNTICIKRIIELKIINKMWHKSKCQIHYYVV